MTRPRRDPRAERVALAVGGSARLRLDRAKPAGSRRPRRDPRAEFVVAEVASPKRMRLDRSGRREPAVNVAVEPIAVSAASSILLMDAPAFLIAAFVDAQGGRLSPHDRQASFSYLLAKKIG